MIGTLLPHIHVTPPGPLARAWVERLGAVECPAITARRRKRNEALQTDDPIVWAEARGANVLDVDGNRYVDLSGGFGVAAVGHAHPRVVAAARAQSERLIHGMGDLFPTREKVLLGEALADIAPGTLQQSIFGCNGGDAVDIAIKTAIMATGRKRVLAFHGGYHGMSLGALSVSGYRDSFREPFAGAVRQELRLPYANCNGCALGQTWPGCQTACADFVERMLGSDIFGSEDVAAVIVEPLQARGGEVVPPDGWLARLREITRQRGILLIADEIYTGLGRTGRMFACEHEGVEPDILLVGKALGGGFPISAAIATPEVMGAWGASRGEAIHTSTFLGNPLGAAMALATLAVLREEKLVERAATLGDRLLKALRREIGSHPRVAEVRGRGLLVGVALLDEASRPWAGGGVKAMNDLLHPGFIVSPSGPMGDVISLSPPYVITENQLDAAVDAISEWVHGLPT
jgi:4-aminobutyrate aminotransferase-like enzyme